MFSQRICGVGDLFSDMSEQVTRDYAGLFKSCKMD